MKYLLRKKSEMSEKMRKKIEYYNEREGRKMSKEARTFINRCLTIVLVCLVCGHILIIEMQIYRIPYLALFLLIFSVVLYANFIKLINKT